MSNYPGIGVLIQQLFGGNGAEHLQAAIGKTIASATLGEDDALRLKFTDGTGIKLADEGQSCCESRYMRTDDELADFEGSTLLGAEIKEAPAIPDPDGYGEHEVQFLEVKTSKGALTMSSHNEHNGYYGGFAIAVHPA